MASTPPLLLVDRPAEAIVRVTLNRPEKRNALSVALIEALAGALREAAETPANRVLLLRGAGPIFCAGLDLAEAADASIAHRSAEALAGLYKALVTTPLLTVAVAQGAALGGGAGLLLATDFVVAADDLKVGFPEVRRGLVAALVTALLRRQVGDRTARQIILLGQTLDAVAAQRLGLVSEVAPAPTLDTAAQSLAGQLLTGAPNALVRSKRLLEDLAARPIGEDLEIAGRYHLVSRHDAEAAEGAAAFREKRPPRWGQREA